MSRVPGKCQNSQGPGPWYQEVLEMLVRLQFWGSESELVSSRLLGEESCFVPNTKRN